MERFKQYEKWTKVRNIDKGIMGRFKRPCGWTPALGCTASSREVSVRLAESEDYQARRLRAGLVGRLRGMLARACLSSLEPDLVILDEFQRFRDLLDENTESGELAKHLFEYEDARTRRCARCCSRLRPTRCTPGRMRRRTTITATSCGRSPF